MRFLAIGECMAELAPAQATGQYSLGFAGDTFNTAWYLARLRSDLDVAYFTALGDDTLSRQMRAFFVASGIDDRHVTRVPGRTVGLYLISLTKGERSFSYWRGQSAARAMMQSPAALETAIADADVVYVSGITLAILDPPSRDTLLNTLKAARSAGKTIAFDPNLRPRLWADPAEMTATIMQGAAVCDVALPSFEDEAQWFGDADPEATAARYADAGARTVIVKNGPDPVHCLHAATHQTFAVPPLSSVVDTTAAGDSFNAAILAGLADGAALADSIAHACRVAGKVVQGKGALVEVDPAALTRLA